MSFGFEKEQDSVYEAIKLANTKGIAMFAAASNAGANREDNVAWPASAPEVICVHSASGRGTKSSFTPEPDDGKRVMVLGECVQSVGKYMSGTSCAAPIAAGIAAIVLDYARRVLGQDEWLKLRTTHHMKNMFKIMKNQEKDGYWWIRPWVLFGKDKKAEWIEEEIRRALKP